MESIDAREKIVDPNKQGKPLSIKIKGSNKKKLYIESYGCQMNMNDSEIVASILSDHGYNTTMILQNADLIMINTCSIREKAEQTIRKRLEKYNAVKKHNPNMKVAILGCMAERLKDKLLDEKIIDMIVGPDAYRDIPNLLKKVDEGKKAVNVILSKEETYEEISPIRIHSNGVSAFVTIMRGCDNMCTFCVVPFTRGRERSRDPQSIISEIRDLEKKRFKEIVLLGQNVDSYLWYGGGLKKDFKKASDIAKATAINFSDLLDTIANYFPKMWIRFFTNNPQDMKIEVLHTMAKYENICKYLHLPIQSGSTGILKKMNRQHTREDYIDLIDNIRKIIPDCAISQDIIVGFCGETESDHHDTLSLMKYVGYDYGFMFTYSERPGTLAQKKFPDDVPEDVKKKRLTEIIDLQRTLSYQNTRKYIENTTVVLIEGDSKKSKNHWKSRNSQNHVVVFPKTENQKIGDFVNVKVTDCTSATLFGEYICHFKFKS